MIVEELRNDFDSQKGTRLNNAGERSRNQICSDNLDWLNTVNFIFQILCLTLSFSEAGLELKPKMTE